MTVRNQSLHPLAATTSFAAQGLAALNRIEYRRVVAGNDLEEIFRLRYNAYRREELIESDASHQSADAYDRSPNAQIFGLYFEDRLASSLRIHFATPTERTCPTNSHFPGALDSHFDRGFKFIDSSRFCADSYLSGILPFLPFMTIRLTAMACIFFDADFTLSVIRPEHAGFYKRYYGMKKWKGSQKVDWFAHEVDLYANGKLENSDSILSRLPFFRSLSSERKRLFGTPPEGVESVSVTPSAEAAILIAR
ncbi:N-acyl amino acid synthase FeeM domain-containing protein [Rhizobium tumorigenes]|uniref:N-acyl amino acid synthase FeeM domain-containing protein n=1 Tax=Rhizobium tumorigenes TaxID=2041385 RepID=UPI00241CA922|nr:hypothetical protein [Rhizobium tumorigenes]WFS03331.1 hypothetical protein PR016_18670 [Rhizobium tumorigenes]